VVTFEGRQIKPTTGAAKLGFNYLAAHFLRETLKTDLLRQFKNLLASGRLSIGSQESALEQWIS
jgi:hypothetical protein